MFIERAQLAFGNAGARAGAEGSVGALQERKAAVIRAEGESEAAKLISQATKEAGPGMIELRRIEAAKDIAEKMARSRNVVYLPSGTNMLMGLGTGTGA